MGFLDKLMFWKDDDSFLDDFNNPPDHGFGVDNTGLPPSNLPSSSPSMSGLGSSPTSFGSNSLDSHDNTDLSPGLQNFDSHVPSSQSSFSQNSPPSQVRFIDNNQQSSQSSNDSFILSKNIEVLSSKMDVLKASLESINQRLANIERIAYQNNEHESHPNERRW